LQIESESTQKKTLYDYDLYIHPMMNVNGNSNTYRATPSIFV